MDRSLSGDPDPAPAVSMYASSLPSVGESAVRLGASNILICLERVSEQPVATSDHSSHRPACIEQVSKLLRTGLVTYEEFPCFAYSFQRNLTHSSRFPFCSLVRLLSSSTVLGAQLLCILNNAVKPRAQAADKWKTRVHA